MANKNKYDQKTVLEFQRISETHRTRRVLGICATIVICVGIICWTIVRLTDQPPWLVLALALIPPLPPAGMAYIGLRLYVRYVKRHNGRVGQLEKQLDPKRSSSSSGTAGTQERALEKDGDEKK